MSWRDPFVFKTDGRTFMILTAELNGNAVVPIYEASNASLLDWEYRGIMFTIPRKISRFLECPNFVKLGEKWVLIGSGFGTGVAAIEVPVREAKQVLTGNGNAGKNQLEEAVRRRLNHPEPIRPYHASDAIGLALIGFYRYYETLKGIGQRA